MTDNPYSELVFTGGAKVKVVLEFDGDWKSMFPDPEFGETEAEVRDGFSIDLFRRITEMFIPE